MSLSVPFIAPQANVRCICSWTRYANLLAWFDNFKVFLIEFGFAIVGTNEKGGMNNEEFERYIDNSIVPLFPDLEDTPGKCILLKVDSGHG